MTLGPVLPGRIPDSFSVMRTQRNVHTSARELANIQQQIATGQRYFFGSEAVSDAIKTVQQQSLGERKTQAVINTQTNFSLLGAADSALSEISDVLNAVKSVSLSAIGDATTPAEKEHFITELNTLIDAAINAGNREFRGRKHSSADHKGTTHRSTISPVASLSTATQSRLPLSGILASFSQLDSIQPKRLEQTSLARRST